MEPKPEVCTQYCLDVAAAYNRSDLPLAPWPGMPIMSIREAADHPLLLARLAEQDTEDVLMDLYVQRRRWMQ